VFSSKSDIEKSSPATTTSAISSRQVPLLARFFFFACQVPLLVEYFFVP